MTMFDDRYAPTMEFRERLESEILVEIRRGAQRTSPSRGVRRRPWLRTAALVLLSLGLGAAGGVLSAQVQDNEQRARLLAVERAELELAARRVEIARAAVERAREKVRTGVTGRDVLLAAEAELRAMEAQLERTSLDIAEIERTSIPPRDDLSAPRVAGRDFVRQRLELELATAQQELVAAERALAVQQERYDRGSAHLAATLEAREEEARARARLMLLAEKAAIREEALRNSLSAAEVAGRAERAELASRLRLAGALRELSVQRLEQARARRGVGAIEEVDVLRVELEAAELEAEIRRLEAELAALSAERRE